MFVIAKVNKWNQFTLLDTAVHLTPETANEYRSSQTQVPPEVLEEYAVYSVAKIPGTVIWATRDKDGYIQEWTEWANPERTAHQFVENRIKFGLSKPGEETVLMRVIPPWTEVR